MYKVNIYVFKTSTSDVKFKGMLGHKKYLCALD